jgi:hypothetical protein
VNFIGARVICSYCIRKEQWKENLSEENSCAICGIYRSIAFTIKDFKETYADKKYICRNPMKTFINWLLHEFNYKSPQKDYENIVLAHNGGRFDHVLLFGELFNIEGIVPQIIAQGNKFYEITVRNFGITTNYFRDT